MEKDSLSKEIKGLIKEFDEKHVITNIILLGLDEAIRNIQIGFEFDETYTEKRK